MSQLLVVILLVSVLITGLIALVDIVVWAPKRRQLAANRGIVPEVPVIVDYARSFFPVLLLVFLLRSFVAEPFRIPSGSLEPTIEIGDFILANKYAYGFRWPLLNKKIYAVGKPARGDIIVFYWPPNKKINYIKRVIGLPGDKISYINKVLTINGQVIEQVLLGGATGSTEPDKSESESGWAVIEKEEDLLGVKHRIYQRPAAENHDLRDVVVPEGQYFVMGDNRDDSADSRFWGFVPEENLIGKAFLVWMSWDSEKMSVRWKRIGTRIVGGK